MHVTPVYNRGGPRRDIGSLIDEILGDHQPGIPGTIMATLYERHAALCVQKSQISYRDYRFEVVFSQHPLAYTAFINDEEEERS